MFFLLRLLAPGFELLMADNEWVTVAACWRMVPVEVVAVPVTVMM